MMRVLQIFNQYRFRGGEEAWVETVPELLAGLVEVDELRFLSTNWSDGAGPSPLRQVMLMGNNPDSRAALRHRVLATRPDLLVFHNVIPVASFGMYDEARLLGIPVIQYIHNFRPFSPGGTLWAGDRVNDAALHGNPWPEILSGGWQGSRVKTAVLAWHLKQARDAGLFKKIDRWIAPSQFMRDKFVAAGVDGRKIEIIPHCYLGEIGAADNSAPPVGGYYLYLGRLERDKGVELLLQSWA